jgi:ATP-dependent DNA ligase
LEDGSVAVFSRNSEDMSKKYPDLVEQLPRVSSSLILNLAIKSDPLNRNLVYQRKHKVLRP